MYIKTVTKINYLKHMTTWSHGAKLVFIVLLSFKIICYLCRYPYVKIEINKVKIHTFVWYNFLEFQNPFSFAYWGFVNGLSPFFVQLVRSLNMAASMEEADDEGNETLGFVIDEVINNIGSSWDPTNSVDWEREKVTPQCLTRIKR